MTKPQSARAALMPTMSYDPAPMAPVTIPLRRTAPPLPRQAPARSGPGHGPIPDLTPVKSSNIAGVAHDGGSLWVRFTNGSLYKYPTAGRDLHEGLVAAASPGRYHMDKIRHFHSGERIE